MTPIKMEIIGRSFLPDHSKDRWRKEVARLTGYSERMVRYWEKCPKKHPIPLAVEKALLAEFQGRCVMLMRNEMCD
jgi:hypothetical protein